MSLKIDFVRFEVIEIEYFVTAPAALCLRSKGSKVDPKLYTSNCPAIPTKKSSNDRWSTLPLDKDVSGSGIFT